MGFIDDLKKGLPGLKLSVPASWQVREEHERRAVLTDSEHRTGWHVAHAPWRYDLRPEHAAVLRGDIERSARHAFAEQYAQLGAQQPAAKRPPPRIADPQWSPVIDVEHVTLGGAPAVLSVRRLAYEPGLEAVLGSLLVPVATGLCEITAFARSSETGYRESMLLDLALQQGPREDRQQLARRLGQHYFDDPRNDEKFGNHPLTLVRGALRWLLSAGEDVLQVTAAMLPPPPGELELLAPGCVIIPPPRYLLLPTGTVPVPRTMAVLSRVQMEAGESPLMLDVWRLPGVQVDQNQGPDRQGQLLELVRKHSGEWEQQGATDVNIDITALPGEGGLVHVQTHVRMRVQGGAMQSLGRWLLTEEGQVFRIAVGAPAYVPAEELIADTGAVVRSFRKLLTPQNTAWLTSDLRLRPKPPALE